MTQDFGGFAKAKRLQASMGLRQAARAMNVSPTYLSRVENNLDPPSAELIVRMSRLYAVNIEDLSARAKKRAAAARGSVIQVSPELTALYRIGSQLPAEEIDEILRAFLKKKNFSKEQIEKELAQLKAELPRIDNNGRDGLFAAKAKPRFLSRTKLSQMACELLARRGISPESYSPPTPVELLAEAEPSIRYRIDKLTCRQNGEPLLLGLTGWNETGEREIVINSALAESTKKCDEHRFNFTLAHELFHAVEHLPRIAPEDRVSAPQFRVCVAVIGQARSHRLSSAERAVTRWVTSVSPRLLSTDEDWREWQANAFASALLMPEWAVTKEFQRRVDTPRVVFSPDQNIRERALDIAGETIFENAIFEKSLSELFEVSRQAMAIRLLELGLVTEKN